MNIPSAEAAKIATRYDLGIVVIVGYDWATLEVASFGKLPIDKDVAADWADRIVSLVEFDAASKKINEDFRATPAAEYKRKIDAALAALEQVVDLVPVATSYDGSPVVSLLECWKIQEIARAAVAELRG